MWKMEARAIAGLEDGRGPQVRECGQPPGDIIDREMDSPLEPPEGNAALPASYFNSVSPTEFHFRPLDLQDNKLVLV